VLVAASVSKYSSPDAIAVLRFLPDGRPGKAPGGAGTPLVEQLG
jgi:hypothetical protein